MDILSILIRTSQAIWTGKVAKLDLAMAMPELPSKTNWAEAESTTRCLRSPPVVGGGFCTLGVRSMEPYSHANFSDFLSAHESS